MLRWALIAHTFDGRFAYANKQQQQQNQSRNAKCWRASIQSFFGRRLRIADALVLSRDLTAMAWFASLPKHKRPNQMREAQRHKSDEEEEEVRGVRKFIGFPSNARRYQCRWQSLEVIRTVKMLSLRCVIFLRLTIEPRQNEIKCRNILR